MGSGNGGKTHGSEQVERERLDPADSRHRVCRIVDWRQFAEMLELAEAALFTFPVKGSISLSSDEVVCCDGDGLGFSIGCSALAMT
jgi:hypothetical protein